MRAKINASLNAWFLNTPLFNTGVRLILISGVTGMLLCGCAPVQSTNIKYESQKEVLLQVLEEYPKEVILNGGDAIVANERLGILFSRELKVKPQVTKSKDGLTASWNAGTENLIIKVSRRLVSKGHLYAVDVVPRTAKAAEDADLAARNIARFIKTGIFERSLFEQ